MAKIIEGDIVIEDNASKGLTAAEKACKALYKQLSATIKKIPELEAQLESLSRKRNKDDAAYKAQIKEINRQLEIAAKAQDRADKAGSKLANAKIQAGEEDLRLRRKIADRQHAEEISSKKAARDRRYERQREAAEIERLNLKEENSRKASERRITERTVAEELSRKKATRDRLAERQKAEQRLQQIRERGALRSSIMSQYTREIAERGRMRTAELELNRNAVNAEWERRRVLREQGDSAAHQRKLELLTRARELEEFRGTRTLRQRDAMDAAELARMEASISRAISNAASKFGPGFVGRGLNEFGGRSITQAIASARQIDDKRELIKELQKIRDVVQKRLEANPWKRSMMERADRGRGFMSRLYGGLSQFDSFSDALSSPSALKDVLFNAFGNGIFGRMGKGIIGAIGGNAIGGMIGGTGGSVAGSLIGGGAAGGAIGIAMAAVVMAVKAAANKVVDYVRETKEIIERWSSERASESTGLRKKMQMSNEMFGIGNPRDVTEIDRQIYGLRRKELEYYRNGASGRQITSSAIDWLHLLGTSDTGGTFANREAAFRFSEALSNLSKANNLSDAEAETVRYQGMQILSKGYADILDIKPLLNSAPGFVREILAQTGMTRAEFLKSSSNPDMSQRFTAEKFLAAVEGVADYYRIFNERATSRTPEQQKEAAEAIVGMSSVLEEKEKKLAAEANIEVAKAEATSEFSSAIQESWYKMWSDTNDAQDGINAKVRFEMKVVKAISALMGGVLMVVTAIKNVIDLVFDTILFVRDNFFTGLKLFVDQMWYWFKSGISWLTDKLPENSFTKDIKQFGKDIDPDSQKNRRKYLYEHLIDDKTEDLYKVMKSLVEQTTVSGRLAQPGLSGLYASAINGMLSDMYPLVKFDKSWLYEGKTPAEKEESKRVGRIISFREFKDFIDYGLESAENRGELESPELAKAMGLFAASTGVKLGDYTRKQVMLRQSRNGLLGYGWGNILDIYKQEIDDIVEGGRTGIEMFSGVTDALEKTQNPMLDKQVADNTKQIAENTGKTASAVSEKIVDILKEIAGVTVINKQTMVRPDLVFNFGSYGRSGSGELPNYIGNGEISAGPAFTKEQLEQLSKWTKNAIDRLFGRGGANVDSSVEIYNGEAR